jgi:hypothetical protein
MKISSEKSISFNEAKNTDTFAKLNGLDELKGFSMEMEDEHTMFAELGKSKLPKAKKNEFGIIGGVGFSGSLVNTNNEGVNCVSEVLGLSYQHYFNGGFSLMSNLLYAPRNGVNAVKYYDKELVYGFGSVTKQTVRESSKLVYLELPIMINYNLGNHNFMFGPSVSYLVTGKHEFTTMYESQTNETTMESSSKWGYIDGFEDFDVAVVAGYEYGVKPNLNIGLRVNYGLTDITNNQYFGTDSFDNNVQFRLYLKYSPFNF